MLFSSRKKKHDSGINTNGWMMSYADMATTLLAMFIVLSTLGKDQTGISLYNGTGSFVNTQKSLGIPGLFPNSAKVVSLQEASPHYQSEPIRDGFTAAASAAGKDRNQRVIDSEDEQLQRFLRELNRRFTVEKLPRNTGQAVVDFYETLNRKPPYLGSHQTAVLGQVIPVLHRSNYRVMVIVWATTPSESAWTRATNQARLIVEEIARAAELDGSVRSRLLPIGQPWRYADVRRPIMSLVIAKTD